MVLLENRDLTAFDSLEIIVDVLEIGFDAVCNSSAILRVRVVLLVEFC